MHDIVMIFNSAYEGAEKLEIPDITKGADMIVGIQLYGLLCKNDKDLKELLPEICNAGASFVEPCVTLSGENPMPWCFLPKKRLEELMPYIQELGLTVPSCHIASENLLKDAPEMARLAESYGIRYFVIKLPSYDPAKLQEYAFQVREAAEIIKASGAKLLLHNGKEDIETKIAGRSAYEYFTDICLGALEMQLDTGWAEAGGAKLSEFLAKNESRIASVHFKDFANPGTDSADVPIGAGSVDIRNALQFGRANGCMLVVDQDVYGEFPEDMLKSLRYLNGLSNMRDHSVSYLNILDTETMEVKVLKRFDYVIEAPNWLRNQNALIYNSEGKIFRFDLDTLESTQIPTGAAKFCNNDHVVSYDEQWIAVSAGSEEVRGSRVYKVPLTGGEAQLLTEKTPSYLHGWSPDGKTLVYCAFREIDGELHVDVYGVSDEGGEETRLTTEGFNDGPEFSFDGEWIYFISTRTGLMQVWRMKPDGSEQTQLTFEEQNNWFGHISPDGSKVVSIVYKKGQLLPNEHLSNMHVELWLMNPDGSDHRRILGFFGGQGSINVNSWAPDSRRLAFVSYDVEL